MELRALDLFIMEPIIPDMKPIPASPPRALRWSHANVSEGRFDQFSPRPPSASFGLSEPARRKRAGGIDGIDSIGAAAEERPVEVSDTPLAAAPAAADEAVLAAAAPVVAADVVAPLPPSR